MTANAVARRDADQVDHVFGQLRSSLGPVARIVENEDTARRLIQLTMTEIRHTPQLLECSAESIVGALMLCAQYDLEPGPREHVYLIPRWNSKTKTREAEWTLGYRGMIELAGRQGIQIVADAVKQNDHWAWWRTADRDHFEHRRAEGDRGDIVRAYAVARYPDGRPPLVHVSDLDEIHKARSLSEAPTKGPWKGHFEAMAIKTPVRRLFKWVGSPMLTEAAAADGTVRVAKQPQVGVEHVIDKTLPPAQLAQGDATPVVDGPELHDLTAGQHAELNDLGVDDDVRHTLVHLATGGRTTSSKALTKQEQDTLMTVARAFGRDAITLTGDLSDPASVTVEADGVELSVDDVMAAARGADQ